LTVASLLRRVKSVLVLQPQQPNYQRQTESRSYQKAYHNRSHIAVKSLRLFAGSSGVNPPRCQFFYL